ncbi:flagellar motor switch protein FliG [Desulfurobacterium thermolithotrophum DSM 11699]|uniref:Flagellar motor switch protein FliG n=1 Tax=Desulfurobacterium thermolithotrophum (strain DSM 11699 / BSA) TaxID=868864 RepID=F0S0P7_DESTD|nr:flagellar motor switch protein FliG [Desulfurobacterium thermolithotrophum]ADY73850.1 flagellar motor switch protein FliG [Desulfurobacterium thermolithotrophum DSM 11699]
MPEEEKLQRTERITGAQKAAILILTLPEDIAVNVIKNLKEHELNKLAKTILTLGTIKRDMVKLVLKEARDELAEIAPLKTAPNELRRLLEKALPPEKLQKLLEETMMTESGKVIFNELQKLDPKFIAKLIEKEHPQIIAIILSQLKPTKAADVIQYLPKRLGITNVQEEVIKRLAMLEKVSMKTLRIVTDALEEELASLGAGKEETLSGIDIAAEIVNNLPKEIAQDLLDEIRKENPSLADSIEERMFKFEDIIKLDNRAIIEILKAVDKNDLLLALKGAPEDILNKFLSNMSKRAAQMFLEDMEALGPVKKSDVEKARKKVIAIIKKLAEEGKIELGGSEELV